MNTINKTSITIVFSIAVVLFFLFGIGAVEGTISYNQFIGNRMSSSIHWMWIPTSFTLGIVSFLGWLIFKEKY